MPGLNFETLTSPNIRTLRRPEHHSDDQTHFPNVDVNEDSHPPMHRTLCSCSILVPKRPARRHFPNVDVNEVPHLSSRRTPLWCRIAFSKSRRQRGFAHLGAQNTTLATKRIFQTSTSTRIRTFRRPEHRSGDQTHFPNGDVNEDSHPWTPRTPLW